MDKKALDLLSFVAVLLSSTQAYAGIMGVVSLSVVGVRFLYALRKSNWLSTKARLFSVQ